MLNKTRRMFGLLAALCTSSGALSAEGASKHADLIRALPAATITLQLGLTAAAAQGQPLSAKYEVEGGLLQLSVYTAKGGSYSELVVDHRTGKVTRAVTPLAIAVQKAEQASRGYRAVSVIARRHQQHAVAIVELLKGKQFKTVSESLE